MMNLDVLRELDKSLLLTFNGGNNLFLDYFILTVTSAYTWIPLYASLLYLVIKNNENWQKIMLIVGMMALGLLIVNGVNIGIVKPFIARPRPLILQMLLLFQSSFVYWYVIVSFHL